jgi:ABC-type Fe3+ transport system substrate-binding protein
VGLSDTDDAYAAQREGWQVGMAYPRAGLGGCAPGPMLVPNTVALVKGSPHPEAAAKLIDFLISERAERMLAASESHNLPVRAKVAAEFAEFAPPAGVIPPDLGAVGAAVELAFRIWEEEMGG